MTTALLFVLAIFGGIGLGLVAEGLARVARPWLRNSVYNNVGAGVWVAGTVLLLYVALVVTR